MHKVKLGFVLAALTALFATSAWASDVQGRVVCTGTDAGIANVEVMFQYDDASGTFFYSGLTGADGVYNLHVWPIEVVYGVSIDLSGAGVFEVVSEGDWYIGLGINPTPVLLPDFQVDVPGCTPPPPAEADCSPGYYKNHPETWCTRCGYDAAACTAEVANLSAKGSESAAIRDAAKARIDACFGTAEASPCLDDDL